MRNVSVRKLDGNRTKTERSRKIARLEAFLIEI
jgi:hypothetical protein